MVKSGWSLPNKTFFWAIIIFGRYCWFALHVAIGYAVEAVVLMNHCWLPLTWANIIIGNSTKPRVCNLQTIRHLKHSSVVVNAAAAAAAAAAAVAHQYILLARVLLLLLMMMMPMLLSLTAGWRWIIWQGRTRMIWNYIFLTTVSEEEVRTSSRRRAINIFWEMTTFSARRMVKTLSLLLLLLLL